MAETDSDRRRLLGYVPNRDSALMGDSQPMLAGQHLQRPHRPYMAW